VYGGENGRGDWIKFNLVFVSGITGHGKVPQVKGFYTAPWYPEAIKPYVKLM
jgi:hypothetical protein